jgi:hypothetical protein
MRRADPVRVLRVASLYVWPGLQMRLGRRDFHNLERDHLGLMCDDLCKQAATKLPSLGIVK